MKKYDYIIFDFDGTILDSVEGIVNAFLKALEYAGLHDTKENIRALVGPPLSKTIITKYGLDEETADKAMEKHRAYYKEKGVFEANEYDGVKEMLIALKNAGLKTAIATNKPEVSARQQLSHFKLDIYFDAIVGQNEKQTRGTKGDMIKIALKEIGCTNLEKAVMIGDRGEDMKGAREANIDGIGVLYDGSGAKKDLLQMGALATFNTPLELADALLN